MISVKHKGDFKNTTNFLVKVKDPSRKMAILNKFGAKGVDVLKDNTPFKTGKTANSWSYEVTGSGGEYTVSFKNSNENKGVNIAIILQYGHVTRQGGFVQGRDYINPAIQPVFEEMANELWEEVRRS